MALRGLKVVEMAGLAPAPFAGMVLAGKLIMRQLLIQVCIPFTFNCTFTDAQILGLLSFVLTDLVTHWTVWLGVCVSVHYVDLSLSLSLLEASNRCVLV